MNSAEHKWVGPAMHDRIINITDEELRKAMTGVWERRRQLRAVSQ